MQKSYVHRATEFLEKSNAELQPELLGADDARELLEEYVRAKRSADFGIATLTRKIQDASTVAKVTGTSMGQAKETVATGQVMGSSAELSMALQEGDVSFEQAAEIAKAEESAPGCANKLIGVATTESFQVLRESARKTKLEAEQHGDLGQRQREARSARGRIDDLGMVEIYLRLQPHTGIPLMNRAETEARRLYKAAKRAGKPEPFERYLADAYAEVLSRGGKPSTTKADVLVLVSYEVAKRGWKDVRPGEHCKVPGGGPITPQAAKELAEKALLSAVLFDGKDLRHFKTFGKHIPREIALALQLGEPPDFDGVKCVDCGSRFHPERDHVEPRNARGPTSKRNLKWRCDPCHDLKTAADRKAGKLKPQPKSKPGGKSPPAKPGARAANRGRPRKNVRRVR